MTITRNNFVNNKYKYLAKNTIIFAIGGFGSRILSFLIVPLYTYVLTTEEYGKIDLFTTAVGLIVPFSTMLIQEAMLRFLMAGEIDEKEAINNSMVIFMFGALVSLIIYPVYRNVFKMDEYTNLFLVILILNSFTQIFSQYLRATGENIAFSINGVIVTAVTLFCNLLFLVFFKLGMIGYFYAIIFAQMVSMLYIVVKGRIFCYLSIKYIRKDVLKEMLKYSIPLIPNSLMWWLMSAGDKYIINYFLGDGANGLYSLAMKVPTILTMIYSMFFQAWQMSAIEEADKEGSTKFYSNVYVLTNALLAFLTSLIIILIRPVYTMVMSETFSPAWYYVPALSIATILNCDASFFGVVYTVFKNTKNAFITTLLGAIVNLVCSCCLVPLLGMQGVAIGTGIGYGVVCLIRALDARREIGMTFDVKRTMLVFGLLVAQAYATIKLNDRWLYVVGIVCIFLLTCLYCKEVKGITQRAMNKLKKGFCKI